MGAAVGDYDNDGHEDIFVAGVHGIFLYHNNGDGTFSDVTQKAGLGGPGSLESARMVHRRLLDRLRQRCAPRSAGLQLLRLEAGRRPGMRRPVIQPEVSPSGEYASQPAQLYHNNGYGNFH